MLDRTVQDWFTNLLGVPLPPEGELVVSHGRMLTMRGDILRAQELLSESQEQTSDAFSFKWAKRDTFEEGTARFMRSWLIEKYGDVTKAPWLFEGGPHPVLLDAGCGAAMSGLALFAPVLDRIRYIGADVSAAVDVAKSRFEERGISAAFVQADLNQLPLAANSVDLVFSEGVLHHTDDTRAALSAVTRHLKPGGRILFYVYRKKGPIREFSDEYVREKMQAMTPEQGWAAMQALTKLGKALGELNIDIDVPERIDLLNIPAGRINLQRFVYWHVLKAFYRPDYSLDEMNHINFDWFAPKNAHRQTPEQVHCWCGELNLTIEHERVEEAGITVIARKSVLADKLLQRLEDKLDEARAAPWEHTQPIAIDLDLVPRVSAEVITVGLVFRVQSRRREWVEVHREPPADVTSEDSVDDLLARGLSVFLMKHPGWPK